MKRIEIYVNNKGSLTMDVFKHHDDEYVAVSYQGVEAYELIRKISSQKVVDTYENLKDNCLLAEYKNLIVNINEPEITFKKKGMVPLFKCINRYYESQELHQIKEKKVTRKNKYSSRRMIATGLAALALITTAYGIFGSKQKKEKFDVLPNNIITEVTDPKEESEFIIETTPIVEETKKEEIIPVSINYEDRSSTDRAYETKAWYNVTLTKYANRYGLDPKLVLAIATQERGKHSEVKDEGGATGLMQIQNGVWEDEYITAYNFETSEYEKEYVTNAKIKDVFNNIRYGCMYLQNCMEYMNYNTVAAVQCYNMGYKNMMKILKAYSLDTNRSIEEILNDKYDTGWMDYRYIIDVGDKNYVENVFSWLGPDFEVNNTQKDNTLVATNISNQIVSKKIY